MSDILIVEGIFFVFTKIKEIEIKSKGYNDLIETIYFGGGTPSFFDTIEINKIINVVFRFVIFYFRSEHHIITLTNLSNNIDKRVVREFPFYIEFLRLLVIRQYFF